MRKALAELPPSLKKGGVIALLVQRQLDWHRQHRPSRNRHPVLSPIFEAYIARMEQVLNDWNPSPDRINEQKKVWDELIELRGWVHRGPQKWEDWTQDHDDAAGNTLVKDYGKSYSEAKQLIRKTLQLRGGRPGTSRLIAVNGLELKLLHSSLRWIDVRDQVCDCGKAEHDDSCLSRLKTAVTELKALLRRYGLIDVVERRECP